MIDLFVGGFILWLCAIKDKIEKKDRIDPEEYYPYMYDHFNDDSDCDGEN
jgi:hypothetical protein